MTTIAYRLLAERLDRSRQLLAIHESRLAALDVSPDPTDVWVRAYEHREVRHYQKEVARLEAQLKDAAAEVAALN